MIGAFFDGMEIILRLQNFSEICNEVCGMNLQIIKINDFNLRAWDRFSQRPAMFLNSIALKTRMKSFINRIQFRRENKFFAWAEIALRAQQL